MSGRKSVNTKFLDLVESLLSNDDPIHIDTIYINVRVRVYTIVPCCCVLMLYLLRNLSVPC